MTEGDPHILSPDEKSAIARLFSHLPNDLTSLEFKLKTISSAIRTETARHLETAINNWFPSLGQMDLGSARFLAAFLDSELESLGLCVFVNDEPALLVAERSPQSPKTQHKSDAMANFVLLTGAEKRPYFKKAVVSDIIPRLTIGPAPERIAYELEPLRHRAYGSPLGR